VRSVTEVEAVMISDDGKTALVQVDTGQHVRILKPANLRKGVRLRMRRTEYKDGELRFDLIGSTTHEP
jgi:hypothetical protein